MICARREGPQQRLRGLRLPVEQQAETKWSASSRAASGPSPRRLGVPDGVHHLALPDKPLRGPAVHAPANLVGQAPAQLQPQEIRETGGW